jgi:hypothetical protein
MAFLSGLFSLLTRQLSTLLRAVFGWSVTGLFGRLPAGKQTALSVALVLALVWPLLVVGVALPGVAAWAVALVPLHELVARGTLRMIWLALALVAPLVVGAIVRWVAPAARTRGSWLKVVLGGYPLTLGFFAAFVVTLAVVPAMKLASLAKGWVDEHVYVQVREGAYRDALRDVRRACESAGIALVERPVPRAMSLASRVLVRIARDKLAAVVPDAPRMLAGEGLEIHLYPADLLLRGESSRIARARAVLVRALVRAPVHLVESDVGQALEDELDRMWRVLDRHARDGHAPGAMARRRVREIAAELDTVDVPFDQWVVLYLDLLHLDRALERAGTPRSRTARAGALAGVAEAEVRRSSAPA